MEGYIARITETSRDLSGKEKVQIINATDCVKLDDVTKQGAVVIDLDYYAEIAIHNENSEDKDYNNYILVDKNGTKYRTGSPSLWSTFKNIYEAMEDEAEPWQLKVFRMPSKKREGKDFLTCAVI